MKILLCTNQYDTISNGPVRFVHLILGSNKPGGEHEIRVLSEDIAEEIFGLYKVEIPAWLRESILSQLFRMWFYHRKAMAVRKVYPFDVMVYNHALVGLWSALRFKNTAGMFNDEAYSSFRWQKERLSRSWLKKSIFRQAEKAMFRICDKVIVNSVYLEKTLKSAYGDRNKVFVMYKGISVSGKIPERKSFEMPVNILFVKTDYKAGGLQDLIAALKMVAFPFNLHIAGPPAREYRQIRTWLENAGIINVTRLYGYRPPEKVEDLMRKASVFCVPSRREALGMANMEALACGLPVVTTQAGGIPEVLDDGNNGWMVPPENPLQLAAMLTACVENVGLREEKARNGMKYVRRFSEKHMHERFISILNATD